MMATHLVVICVRGAMDVEKMVCCLGLLWFGHCRSLSSSCHISHLLLTAGCSSFFFFFCFFVTKLVELNTISLPEHLKHFCISLLFHLVVIHEDSKNPVYALSISLTSSSVGCRTSCVCIAPYFFIIQSLVIAISFFCEVVRVIS